MPDKTRQQLRERLIQIFRRNRDEETPELDIENLERDMELDALREQIHILDIKLWEARNVIAAYRKAHIESLNQQEEE